ncbi:TRAP transporter small permease [Acidihalobacter ferrooxydans]|uniref:TRAP transporter small permease n=1 Tax=Acidihalobacter ferrooxydans TaxID=1765967 RepID=UPI0018DB6889|nr:TRAP transporter small permease subunit [Acidihalobacter ferrooxydans]
MGRALRVTLDRLYALSLVASAISLLAIAGLVLAGMVARWFDMVLPSVDQLAGYCVAASIFLGLPAAMQANAHIRVTLFIDRAPPFLRQALEFLVLVIGLIVMLLLSQYAAAMVMMSWRYHLVSSGLLPVPLWVPQSTLVAGSAMLSIALLDRLFSLLVAHVPKSGS